MSTQPSQSIIFTGGGSAGHVTPNLPLIKKCLKAQWKAYYIGSQQGIEKSIIEKEYIPFFAIASGKLRRYFSWQNFIDPFRILTGVIQSFFILRKLKPCVIFSKGGFVSFPVVLAGKLLGIPSILHESDLTPGLANRLCLPMAQKICLTFSETLKWIPPVYQKKCIVAGPIIREEAYEGQAQKGREISQLPLDNKKKIIFIYAGSQGSENINQLIRSALPELLKDFFIIHSCGKGKVHPQLNQPGYIQFEYLHETFYHILACADLVISRSGSNTLSELLVFQKPHILIPLSKRASRGEQLFNAHYFEKRGTSIVLNEENCLTKVQLITTIQQALSRANELKSAMQAHAIPNGTHFVYALIKAYAP